MIPLRIAVLFTMLLSGSEAMSAPSSREQHEAHDLLLATNDVYDCAFTDTGLVVAATSGGVVVEGRDAVTALDGLPDTRVLHVVVTHDAIEAETEHGFAKVALSDLHVSALAHPPSAPSPPQALEMYEGGVVRKRTTTLESTCIATSDGLFVGRDKKAPTRIARSALSTSNVAALASDGTTLFIGTFDRGLYRYEGTSLTAVVDAALNPNINALAWDGERRALWVGTARGLVRCAEGTPPCKHASGIESIHTIDLREGGDVIAGGDGSLVFASAAGSETNTVTHKEGAPFRSVWSLATSPDGVIFAGTTTGIYWGTAAQFTHSPESLKRAAMVEGTLPDDWITALAFTGGKLIVGTYNAGMVSLRYADNALIREHADPSVGYVNPNGIRAESGERMTVATMDGLFVGKPGAFSRVPTLGRDVTDVVIEKTGMWIATRRGVSRGVERRE